MKILVSYHSTYYGVTVELFEFEAENRPYRVRLIDTDADEPFGYTKMFNSIIDAHNYFDSIVIGHQT